MKKVFIPGSQVDLKEACEIEIITPETAARYLESSIINRSISRAAVARYRRDMENGRWRMTGDPIRFDEQDRLVDGQHRLKACIAAGVPFRTVVARNLNDEVANVIDSGRPRRAHDVLAMHRYPNSFLLASAARWLMVMKTGVQSTADAYGIVRPSHEEILDIVKANPGLVTSCALAQKPKGTLPSLLAALHYVAAEKLQVKAEDGTLMADHFVNVFTKGEPFYSRNDPALKWREMVIADKLRGVEPTPRTHYVNLVYVWNSFASGNAIQSFRPPETIQIDGFRPDMI